MFRISKLADYAVVILVEMAKDSDALFNTSSLAAAVKLPEPTVSKVLKLLVRGDLVSSTRGINGGYRLNCAVSDITVENIIIAVDGPIAITACVDDRVPDCSLSDCCSVRGRWDDVNTAVRNALGGVTLVDMMTQNKIEKEEVA